MGPRIGALELGEVLGEGGQGRVHRARHRRHAIDVAVKVWAAPRGGADSFRSEARLAAGLDHPNVVPVLDFGTVAAEDAAASAGALRAGQPYLVMELFEGATLSRVIRGGGLPWHEALPLLEALFAGVAHAHARGVLHRDIKPSNVLLDVRSGRVALTDFGVACALGDDVGGERLLAGSPHFMAPEQVTGSWRDWSPSTDLYALGCVAWLLLTGRPPHDGGTRQDVLEAQLHQPLPLFRPRVAVPPALEAWLATLLAKAPEARFQRAADAAWHLGQLGAATRPSVAPSGSAPAAEASSAGTFDVTRTALDGAPREAPPRPPGERRPLAPAPCPDAPPEPPRRARPHVHAGLGAGVFGLRELPLVGREAERRHLWGALKRVHARARAELVLVRGAAGVGKSKLARWLAETAHAAGAATVLAAVHGSPPGAMDGLGPMLARWAGALGAGAEEARAQASRRLAALPLSAADRATLAEMVVEAVGGARLPTQRADRFAALVAFLGALSEGRPVVLWLDDLQWGWEALQLAERVLEAAPFQPMRVLLLGTVREEALLAREDVAVRLDALAERAPAPRAASLQLGPLDARERSALVQELLGLEGELAARVEERSGGNPLFAVQLVGDWIARGCLALGRRGFELTEAGAAESLPRDLGEMWEARVRHALDSAVPEERWALELAATLGHEVDRREWRRACAEAGVAPASRRVADWFERRLIVPAEGGFEEGWSFVHGMLREALLAGARRAGRLASHHAACAAALGEAAAPDRDERRGLHLRAAGRPAEALEPLLRGAAARWERRELARARRVLAEVRAACDALGLPETDPRRVEEAMLGLDVICALGLHEELGEASARWLALAETRSGDRWPAVRAKAGLYRGVAHRLFGEPARSIARLEEAEAAAAALGDRFLQAETRRALAATLADQGEVERALVLYEKTREAAEALDDARLLAKAHIGLGIAHTKRGALEQARAHLEEVVALLPRTGEPGQVGFALLVLGEGQEVAGERDAAEAAYRRAIEHIALAGSGWLGMAQYKLGAVLGAGGRWEEALPLLREALLRFEHQATLPLIACVELVLAAAEGQAQRWEAWDRHAERAFDALERCGYVDSEVALAAELVARHTAEAERRRRVLELALAQWGELGREQERARVADWVARS